MIYMYAIKVYRYRQQTQKVSNTQFTNSGSIFKSAVTLQRMRAITIYVTHTLIRRTSYAEYARHTLKTLKVCYQYVLYTCMLLIHYMYSYVYKGLWSIGGFFKP